MLSYVFRPQCFHMFSGLSAFVISSIRWGFPKYSNFTQTSFFWPPVFFLLPHPSGELRVGAFSVFYARIACLCWLLGVFFAAVSFFTARFFFYRPAGIRRLVFVWGGVCCVWWYDKGDLDGVKVDSMAYFLASFKLTLCSTGPVLVQLCQRTNY